MVTMRRVCRRQGEVAVFKVLGPYHHDNPGYEQARPEARIIGNVYTDHVKAHRAGCASVRDKPARGQSWTDDYRKVLVIGEGSDNEADAALEDWAKRQGLNVDYCDQLGVCHNYRQEKQAMQPTSS